MTEPTQQAGKLEVPDVVRILIEMTDGIMWKEPEADGHAARFTERLNKLLPAEPQGIIDQISSMPRSPLGEIAREWREKLIGHIIDGEGDAPGTEDLLFEAALARLITEREAEPQGKVREAVNEAFDSWYEQYPDASPYLDGMRDAFEAGAKHGAWVTPEQICDLMMSCNLEFGVKQAENFTRRLNALMRPQDKVRELIAKWRDDEKRCNGSLKKCDELSRLEGYYEGRADAADELEAALAQSGGEAPIEEVDMP